MRHVDQIIEAYEKGVAKGSEVSQIAKNAEYMRGRADGVNYANEQNRLRNPTARPVNKIDMIKVIRDTYPGGMSLRDSKDIADKLFEVFGFSRD